jgi:predicted Zn-dependent protease
MAVEAGLRGSAVVRGVSPLKDKIGQQVFNERVTIIDDSTDPGGKMAAPFDDEGTPGQETYLVRNGVLENYICDLKTASELGCMPTGNGFRSKGIYRIKTYEVKPIGDFSNVRIDPGTMTLDEMIGSIDEGVLVKSIGGLLLANLTTEITREPSPTD